MAKSCGNITNNFAKTNAKNELVKVGAIDVYNNILNESLLRQQQKRFRDHAINKYGFRADFIVQDDANSSKIVFNIAAFKAVDVLNNKDTIALIDNKTQGYITQARLNQQPRFEPAFDSMFDASTAPADRSIPTQGLTRMVTLKESLLSRAKRRQVIVSTELRNSKDNVADYNRLFALKQTLDIRIASLEDEIIQLNRIDTRAPEIIAPYIVGELDRLAELTKSIDPADIKEAKDIIKFIRDIAEFDAQIIEQNPLGHPLYLKGELYDAEGNFLLTDTMIQPYKDWAEIAKQYNDKLAIQEVRLIENTFNANQKIQQMFGKQFTYSDIIGQGLKDASWIDSMVMDIAAGITSQNGLLAQVIKNTVDNNFEKHFAWAKEIEEKINNLTPQASEELKKMGYSLNGLGILGVNGVSYDLFKQIIPNTNNQSSGNIVHKYSYKWFENRSEMSNFFQKQMDNIHVLYANADDRRNAYQNAIANRNNWYAKNTKSLDPSLLSSIINDPEFASLSENFSSDAAAIEAHENELKAVVGEDHLNKVIDAQKIKLRQYLSQKEIVLQDLFAEDAVTDVANLTALGKRKLDIWEAEHNPFLGITYRTSGQPFFVGTYAYHSKFEFNEYVPNKADYYDANYAKIEANPKLKEFYDAVYEATSGMKQRFSFDVQQKISATSIPFLQKSIIEILTDKDLTFHQAISKIFREIIDKIQSMFTINKEDQFSYAKTDPNTGIPNYQVSDQFISQNLDKINEKFFINSVIVSGQIGLKKITRFTGLNQAKMDDGFIAEFTQQYLGRRLTREDLVGEFGQVIPLGKIIYRNAQHEIAKEKSFDLPKVIKLYSHLAAQYSARQEMLPLVEMMKQNYQQIKDEKTNNIGEAILNYTGINKETGGKDGAKRLGGLRDNANKQVENWFERVVLGNFGLRKQYGVIKGTKYVDQKYLTTKERETKSQAEDAMEALVGRDENGKLNSPAGLSEESLAKYKRLQKIIDDLGSERAASAAVDSILNFIRFKGLGFNISSGINNFIEGQIANSITASSGNYFSPEFIHTVSPSDMIAGDLIKQATPQLVPEAVAKAEFLASASDVLQDNTNELQKASTKTAFSALRRLNPYYMTAKGEQYNQIPLMVATLKAEPITAIDGTVSNVWDALEGEYLPDSKQWTVKVKEAFRTEENIKGWENYDADNYFNWKSKIKSVIANTHGDFSNTGGMMAKSFQAGQAAMMFKTWLPREFYKRFAVEQDDITTGLKGFKGRWRSQTATTAAITGGIMGSYFMGPIGGIAAASVGVVLGRMYGANSNLTLVQELALVNKMLFKKMIGMPINVLGSLIGRKQIINTQISNDRYESMGSATFTQQDFNNFRANLQEMSIMLSFFAMLLLTKAFLWDDDDETEDPRRMAHNLLANRFMSLAGSGMMYANATDLQKNLNLPLFKFLGDVGKVVADASQAIAGNDILMSGSNAGESRTMNQMQKTFLPGIFQNPLTGGFAPQMERQFVPSEYDSYFFGEEKSAKNEIKRDKASRKQELIDAGELTDDEIKKIINKEYPRRAKGQTYTELLEQIEATEKEDDEVEQ